MYDLLIKGAYVADGSGEPGYQADVAVVGDRIVRIGEINADKAARVIDARGLILAPGFIDPHSHYDAQFAWDPLLTCSPWHGVTTVVTGNCGVGMAPVREDMREYLLWDLVNVEAIPYADLKLGVKWNWSTFPEYMDAMQSHGLGINVAPLVAMTPMRHFVMGKASVERAANAEEITQLQALIREALEAGAFGFSTSILGPHVGYEGKPLASRNASEDEYRALCQVMKELNRGTIEAAVNVTSTPNEAQIRLIKMLIKESGRPVTWLGAFNNPGAPESYRDKIAPFAEVLGWDKGVPQTTAHPIGFQFQMRKPIILAVLPCFEKVLSMEDQAIIDLFSDPEYRQSVREQISGSEVLGNNFCGRLTILDGVGKQALAYAASNKSVAEIATDLGQDPFDTLFDIAIEDGLDMLFDLTAINYTPEDTIPMMLDDRLLIGVSDAGAHVSMLCDAGYTSYILARWVREAKAITLEQAIRRLTQDPARLFGIPKRGLIAEEMIADLVLFDIDKIDVAPNEWRHDLPSGGKRLVQPALGVEYTIVSGQILYEKNQHTGAMPGQVLRSYDYN